MFDIAGQPLTHLWIHLTYIVGNVLLAFGSCLYLGEACCTVVLAWLLLELAGQAWELWRYSHLNMSKLAKPNLERLKAIWERIFELHAVFGMDEFLQGWFLAPAHCVWRGNMEQFAANILFHKRAEELPKEDMAVVQTFVSRMEQAWGHKFPEGLNPNVSSLQWLLEPLQVIHKPLVFYLIVEIAGWLAHLVLWALGFHSFRKGKFRYWVRRPTASPEGCKPEMQRQFTAPASTTQSVPVVPSYQDEEGTVSDGFIGTAAAGMSDRECEQEQDVKQSLGSNIAGFESASTDSAFAGQSWEAFTTQHLSQPRRRRLRRVNDSAASISLDCYAQEALLGHDSSNVLTNSDGMPVVFIHGVGLGMLPYMQFVREIAAACSSSPVIVVEVRHVSLRLCWEAQEVEEVANAVAAMLVEQGFPQACLVGHSYGTFCVSRICQLYPEMVHSLCLIDPVCLLTFHPQLLHNFMYKPPSLNSLWSLAGLVDTARYLTCARDPVIAQSFCRKFPWVELMLWPEEMPSRSMVVLSGRDDLVPAQLVAGHMKLKRHPAQVMCHPHLGHGLFLAAPLFRAGIVAGIRGMVRLGA